LESREVREVREVKEIREDRAFKDFQEREGNFLSEWCGSGISQKNPPRDSTRSTALGGLLLGMCR
jgi:hypothetical protein